MNKIDKFLIGLKSNIYDAMKAINDNFSEIVFVMDDKKQVIGTVTDGDMRRGFLSGLNFNDSIEKILNKDFFYVTENEDRSNVLDLMKSRSIRQLPVLNFEKQLVGVHLLQELIGSNIKSNIAVIMAGGKGERLKPLTEDCPKPMLKVAGKPILERIILQLTGYGIRKIFLSVNYLSDIIEKYFEDGKKFGCEIKYLREEKPLGTGGALSLFDELPQFPFIVMNGDLITQVNVGKLLDFHSKEGAEATIVVRSYKVEIPFGVIINDNSRLVNIQEKPSSHHLINSGIYVFNPSVISYIPKNEEYPITSLFDVLIEQKKPVSVFMLDEEWIDVGRHENLNKANGLL